MDRESAGLFEVDGHDIGKSAANVVLFAADPDAAITRIVEIFECGLLREGMRIGVAQYTNAARTDWTYRPMFPPSLEDFEVVV